MELNFLMVCEHTRNTRIEVTIVGGTQLGTEQQQQQQKQLSLPLAP
jgi:hypothetical protein